MFPLGHLGITLAVVVGGRRWLGDFRIDYRLVLVAALLPDLIDKPLSVALGVGGRYIGHTLVFVLTLTGLFLVVQNRDVSEGQGTVWGAVLLGLAIGTWSHLVLDRMWAMPEVLLWPFLGRTVPVDPFDPFRFLEGYQDPYVLIGDVVGAAFLVYLAWRNRSTAGPTFFDSFEKGVSRVPRHPSLSQDEDEGEKAKTRPPLRSAMAAIAWEDFERVEMRVGEIIDAEEFPEARKPSYRMRIDFGPLGVKKSAAAIQEWYARRDLVGRRVVAVVNFAPKQIANFLSEVLVLGAIREDDRVVLLRPDEGAELGDPIA